VEAAKWPAPREFPRRRHRLQQQFRISQEFAARGHGVALLPEPYALAGVAAGLLERILPRWTSASIPVHAVYRNRKFAPAKLATFLSKLRPGETPSGARISRRRPARGRALDGVVELALGFSDGPATAAAR
jgi:DNA-binding transcriptional LysR family regulator